MEIIDLVDKDGNPTGKTINRGDRIPVDGEYIQVVHIWLQDISGKFLVQKTSERKGGWFATTGGVVSSGQVIKDAAIREVREEIGIDISNEDVIYLGKGIFNGKVLVNVYFLQKDFSKDNFVLQEEEVQSIDWLSLQEVERLCDEKTLRASSDTSFFLVKKYLGNNY